MMESVIEFYNGKKLIASVRSEMVPPLGSLISIRGKTWGVIGVTYALDHADKVQEKCMRANVDLVKVTP